MKILIRKLRGVIGNGLIWASAWVVGGLAFTVIPAFVTGAGLPLESVAWILGIDAIVGFASGSIFSAVLGVAYRNRVLEDMRPSSLGVLGVAAGLIFPVGAFAFLGISGISIPVSALVSSVLVAGGLGWATSVGSLKLARLAPAEPDEEELSSGETAALLSS